MNITDPRVAPASHLTPKLARLLNDARDASMLGLMARCALVAAVGVCVFFVPWPLIYVAPLYWALNFTLLDRFTLMLHCTSHRQLFKSQHRLLNQVIPWLLGPFFGQAPNSYFAHHMGMHHREENLEQDLSSTMHFQRDRFGHWLRYWSRFLCFGLVELARYFHRRGNKKLFRRTLVGEGTYWTCLLVLAYFNAAATFVVFLGPLLFMRTLMMMGNWTQHAFIGSSDASDPYLASITCINTRYNRRCFNDGYHILHHVNPRCHWTEHPSAFEQALTEYGARDAVVFDGVDYFEIWLCLMLGRWQKLASHFVALPQAPVRTREEVVEFLKSRVQPVVRSELSANNLTVAIAARRVA
jgi:fatty acid desaturase